MDLNSTQGTYIGRHKKMLNPNEPYVLGDGDIIKFGQSSIEYRFITKQKQTSFYNDDTIKLSDALLPTQFGKRYVDKGEEILKKNEIVQDKEKSREERQREILACINEMKEVITRSPSPPPENNQNKEEEEEEESNDDDYGPQPVSNNQNEVEEEENEEENSIIDEYKLPVTDELLMKSHTKWVSALSWDKSGARLISGSYDTLIKLWDFGGMVGEPHPFREIEAEEAHPIYCLSYNPSGEFFVSCNDSCRPRVFDRDGRGVITFIRGNTYVRDQKNTTGHIGNVTSVAWHPSERNVYYIIFTVNCIMWS